MWRFRFTNCPFVCVCLSVCLQATKALQSFKAKRDAEVKRLIGGSSHGGGNGSSFDPAEYENPEDFVHMWNEFYARYVKSGAERVQAQQVLDA